MLSLCLSFSELVMLLEWWSATECTLYMEESYVKDFGKEHVIVILNHNYEIDFLCGWAMCERYGVLGVITPRTCISYTGMQGIDLNWK